MNIFVIPALVNHLLIEKKNQVMQKYNNKIKKLKKTSLLLDKLRIISIFLQHGFGANAHVLYHKNGTVSTGFIPNLPSIAEVSVICSIWHLV